MARHHYSPPLRTRITEALQKEYPDSMETRALTDRLGAGCTETVGRHLKRLRDEGTIERTGIRSYRWKGEAPDEA